MERDKPLSKQDSSLYSGGSETRKSSSQEFVVPQVSLPKGGGAIRGVEEKFEVNSVTGTFSFSVPLPFSPSREGAPAISLAYNSGLGNSPFGIGWQLSVPSISRKTEKRLPEYKDDDESDTFMITGSEDLVPLLEKNGVNWARHTEQRVVNGNAFTINKYRPRIEGAFSRIEKWKNNVTGEVHWKTISTSNTHSYYGLTDQSRINDPLDPSKVYEWKLCRSHDDKGNISLFMYKEEDFAAIPDSVFEKNRLNNCTQLYLKKIFYGVKKPYYLGDAIPTESDFMFRVVFDYGEHDQSPVLSNNIIDDTLNIWECRKDPFSTFRSGFEIRTYRRCKRIFCFHCFDELPINPYLTKSLELIYDDDLYFKGSGKKEPGFSFLKKVRQSGYIWRAASNTYSSKSLPESEFSYQQHEWNTDVTAVPAKNIVEAPQGARDLSYLWIDLFNEGISGILIEQREGIYYKSNLGKGEFSQPRYVAPRPSFSGLATGQLLVQDLKGDGAKYLVNSYSEPRGFFKLGETDEWENFKSFQSIPNIDLRGPNVRSIDVTGDGIPDLLVTENDSMLWYEGLGEEGFKVSKRLYKEIDEEKGPALIFNDQEQCIFLTDIDGDGLTDFVRIRNGEICYWSNCGYGKFGRKVTMEKAPVFDHPDRFNPSYLRLADIDGSGITDIIYLGKNDFRVWMNQNGNSWSEQPHIISQVPEINNLSEVTVFDFLGSGTACIVHSTTTKDQPAWYIDIMGSKKPHLFNGYINNCGKEVSIEYKSSTLFYLEDKKEGRNWVTRLPFPVHCISKTRSEDKIRKTVFTSSYRYSHGYFDHEEREFRGFGRVEQLDSDEFSQFRLNAAKNVVEEILHQPPVRTISWFHTGAWTRNRDILEHYKKEFYKNDQFAEYDIPGIIIPADLSAIEMREAYRTCKGMPLRVEVFANDNLPQSIYPFTASHSNAEVRMVQPTGENKYASFMVVTSESLSYNYDRTPSDPKISHSFMLEANEFGMPLKSVSVIYKRVKRPSGVNAIPDRVWNEQNKNLVVYGESFYTNDVVGNDIFRLRAEFESKTFEIGGIDIDNGKFITKNELIVKLATANELKFEDDFSAGVAKRLSSHERVYFLKDDLSGSMNLGLLPDLAITHKSYKLVFTAGLITKYYNNGAIRVTDVMLSDAKYVHSEGDQNWWIQTGEAIYPANARNRFYAPEGSKDAFNNDSFVEYDPHILLVQKATDAIGNFSTSMLDYRALSAVQVTDSNLNRTAVELDELGIEIKSVIMGKAGTNDGDTLADPSSRLEYDLFNWVNNGKPNFAHAFVREFHRSPVTRWQETYTYSDGGGSTIMVKAQSKAGKAKRWNPVTKSVEEIDADPRWIGNGRTIVNNKGSVVKKFESYFSTTHEYENEDALVETGVTSISYYDAIGRTIRKEFPNGTFTRNVFNPWYSESFDVNDTIIESKWYAERNSPDPLGPEPADPETRAAWLAAKHANTPGRLHLDTLGRTSLKVADYGNGKTTGLYSEQDSGGRFSKVFDQLGRMVSEGYVNLLGGIMYGKSAERGERWVLNDVIGRMVRTWENSNREFFTTFDKLHRPISSFVKENNEEILFSHVVYGDQFPNNEAIAKNLKGRPYQLYDPAGVLTITNIDFKGNVIQSERRLAKEYKTAVKWNALKDLTDIPTILSTADAFLESESFPSSVVTDALNRPITVTLPDGSIVQPAYNESNYLDSLQVKVRGVGDFVTFLQNQDYDVRGQRRFVKYGNNTVTKYEYDPQTFRLAKLQTKLGDANSETTSIQNLKYTFDPAGNITQIKDEAQQTHFFRNAVVSPENKYEYNAVYMLTKAIGREHAGLGGNVQRNQFDIPFIQQLPHENDTTAVRNYIENYEYDDCGNIKRLKHIATNANWTQRYKYAYEDNANNSTNRLTATSMPGDAEGVFSAVYVHDSIGHMTSMPHLSGADSLKWNFQDELKDVDLGGGGSAYYVYSSGNKRVRKVIERNGVIQERIYLGGVEIYRERVNNEDPQLERYTLHVSDNTGRIAQVDTKTIDLDNSDNINKLNENNIRYQYTNHLNSAVLETDGSGNVISYEEYHPYGTSAYRVSDPGKDLSLKRYRFSGKERDDETGFYYFGARYYANWLGRWISADPGGFIDGLNIFKYCSNNPIIFYDPNGKNGNPKPLNPLGEVTWRAAGDLSGMNDQQAIEYFEKYAANPKNNVPKYTKGTISVEWTGTGANRKPVFNAEWLDDAGKPLLPREGEMGYVEKMRKQPKAEYSDPANKKGRLTENEHTTPNAQNKAIDPNYDQKAYRNDATVRSPRDVSLDKTQGDNAVSEQIKQRVANRQPVDVTADIDMPSNERFHTANQNAGEPIRPGSINRGTIEQMNNRFESGKAQTLPQGETISEPVIDDFKPPPTGSTRMATAVRYGGYGLLGVGTVFSGAMFGKDISEGRWGSAILSGSGFVGGALTIGGLAYGAATGTTSVLVGAGTVIGAPAAVIGAGFAGWEFGTFINENSGIQKTAQSSGEWAQGHIWDNVYFGATVAAGTAIVTAPYYAGEAIGNRTYDYFATDDYTLVPWRAAWWPF